MPARACDVCRRRKQRCVPLEDSPLCLTCRALDAPECTFLEPPPPKRRRQSSAVTENGTAAAERSAPPRNGQLSQGTSPWAPHELNSPDYPSDSILTQTLGLEKSRTCELIGPNGPQDWVLFNDSFMQDERPASSAASPGQLRKLPAPVKAPSLRKVAPDVVFRMIPDSVSPEVSAEHVTVDDIEELVGPYGPSLVKLYFRLVHPSLPILHKQVFIEKYERTYREMTPHLLGTVYCLAVKWWIYGEDLPPDDKLDEERLSNLAYRAVQESFLRPRINSVQAGLLLLQYQSTTSTFRGSGALTATFLAALVALGRQQGLHLDCTTWSIPQWEKGLRKRLAWALVIQDAFSALAQGYHQIIHLPDWEVQPLTSADFSEGLWDEDIQQQPSIEDGKLMFQEMAKLAVVANRVVRDLYLPGPMRNATQLHEVLPLIEPLGRALADLQRDLPLELRFEYHEIGRLNASACLHLMHHAVSAAVYRRMIWAADACLRKPLPQQQQQRQPQTPSSPASTTVPPAPDMHRQQQLALISFLRSTQLHRARSTLTFFTSLNSHHMEAFWIAPAGDCAVLACSFLALLHVTCAAGPREAERTAALMRDVEWQLRVKSKMGDWIQSALGKLMALGWERWKAVRPETELLPFHQEDEASAAVAAAAAAQGREVAMSLVEGAFDKVDMDALLDGLFDSGEIVSAP